MASGPTLSLLLFLSVAICLQVSVSGQELYVHGGSEASHGKYPWQASLQLRADSKHFCGAVLLSEHWLATAGHCVSSLLPRYVKVTVGLHSLTNTSLGMPTTHFVDRIVVHPKYGTNDTGYVQDIALVHTETSIKENVFTQYAKLPECQMRVNYKCWVTGWGKQSDTVTETISIGTAEIRDAPYMDEQHKTQSNKIPDPSLGMPVDGTITKVESYTRAAGLFWVQVFEQTADKYQYDFKHTIKINPTKAGKHITSTSVEVKKGDVISLYFGDYSTPPIVPYSIREDCQKPTLLFESYSGVRNTFAAAFNRPCRAYPVRVLVKITNPEQGFSDLLRQTQVKIIGTTPEQIVAEGITSGPCLGDDGGALNCNYGGELHACGLYSYKSGNCRAEDTTAVYTDMLFYKPWILETIS